MEGFTRITVRAGRPIDPRLQPSLYLMFFQDIIANYVFLGVITTNKFWFVVAGFVLLVLGTFLPGL